MTAETPKAGEAYLQLGVRIMVVRVTGDLVVYCCREGNYCGPPRSVPVRMFVDQIAKGVLVRADAAEGNVL